MKHEHDAVSVMTDLSSILSKINDIGESATTKAFSAVSSEKLGPADTMLRYIGVLVYLAEMLRASAQATALRPKKLTPNERIAMLKAIELLSEHWQQKIRTGSASDLRIVTVKESR